MFNSGLILVLLGLLAEIPQGLASYGLLPLHSPGPLPGTQITRDLVLIGCLLNFGGLYRMAQAKGRSWGLAFLGLMVVPGAFVGLVTVFFLKSRRPAV